MASHVHVICALIDTTYAPTVRENRTMWPSWFMESMCNQTILPDIIVLCPTENNENWDCIFDTMNVRMGHEGIKCIKGVETGTSDELKAIKKSLCILTKEIGMDMLKSAWISFLLYPSNIHPEYCAEVKKAALSPKNTEQMIETQVIVLNKDLVETQKNYGHIHETIILGKIVYAFFFNTYMIRVMCEQPTPYWVLTLLMWARVPLFPNGAHKFVGWNHRQDILVLQEHDFVIYDR